MSGALLEIEHLGVRFGPQHAVSGVSLRVEPGRVLGIVGRNGSGKSTLLRAAAGVLGPHAGLVRLDGRDITSGGARERARAGLGYLDQRRLCFPDLSVDDNLCASLLPLGWGARGRRRAVPEAFEWFPELAEHRRRPAGDLSGGQQQMLVIAMLMLRRPSCLLLDEPSTGLAPGPLRQLGHLIGGRSVTCLLVEQKLEVVRHLAREVCLMEQGRITRHLPTGQFWSDRQVIDRYLGAAGATSMEQSDGRAN